MIVTRLTPITLVAKYTRMSFKVSFEIDGVVITTKDVLYGESVTAPESPQKSGYVFKGWTLDGAEYSITDPVKKDMTLKAAFEAEQTDKDGQSDDNRNNSGADLTVYIVAGVAAAVAVIAAVLFALRKKIFKSKKQ